MTKEEYVKAFLEGAAFAPQGEVMYALVEQVFDLRQQLYAKHEHIEYMDEVARDGGLTIKCRGCGEWYELPCELSEMSHEGNYCNSGHGGAYHCAP